MKTWCRVNTRKNKLPRDVAEETANSRVIKLLDKYQLTNEIICAAFSCDLLLLQELLANKQGMSKLRNKVKIKVRVYIPDITSKFLLITPWYWNSLFHSLISLQFGRMQRNCFCSCTQAFTQYQLPFHLVTITVWCTKAVWIQSLPNEIEKKLD